MQIICTLDFVSHCRADVQHSVQNAQNTIISLSGQQSVQFQSWPQLQDFKMKNIKSTHVCTVEKPPEELLKFIPGNGYCSRLARRFRRSFLISHKNPFAIAVYKSSAAISEEQRNHLQKHYYMIHPFSNFRCRWERMMTCVLMLSLLLIPYHIAFNTEIKESDGVLMTWMLVMFSIDLLCICDIFVSFFTGNYIPENKDVIMDFWIVSRAYIRGLFVIDLISSVPFDFCLSISKIDYHVDMSVFYTQLLTLFKVFRVKSMYTYLNAWLIRRSISLVTSKIIKLVLGLILFVQWSACLSYLVCLSVNIGIEPERRKGNSWVSLHNLWLRKPIIKWVYSIFRTLSLIFCVGYGFEVPQADEDTMFVSILLSFGCLLKLFFLVLQLTKIVNASAVKYQEMLVQLREYMRHKHMPANLQNRLLNYYEFHFQKSYFREVEILNTLSGQLRQEVILHSCRRLVENVTFFNNIPTALLVRIVSCLHSEIYLVNDVIVKAGTIGDSLFFIATGTVAVYSPLGIEVCHLEDGAHFGEIALVVEGDRRIASVVAVEPCEVFRLDRYDFMRVVSPYPDLLSKVEQIAVERMEKTLQLDEENRRYQNQLKKETVFGRDFLFS